MAAFKQFNSPDIIVSPLEVNKSFTFSGDSELSASNVDVNRFLGKNIERGTITCCAFNRISLKL